MKTVLTLVVVVIVLIVPVEAGELTPLADIKGLFGPKPQAAEVDQIVQQYEAMAFHDEKLNGTSESFGFVHKWDDGEIVYRVDPKLAQHRARIIDAVAVLAQLTGLHFIDEPYGEGGARTGITFHEDLRDELWNTCVARTKRGQARGLLVGADIYFHKVFIIRRNMVQCAVEEVSQTLGLFADADYLDHTLFRTETADRKHLGLSWYDAILIRAHYDDRIKPGMSKRAAMKIVPVIIEELIASLNR